VARSGAKFETAGAIEPFKRVLHGVLVVRNITTGGATHSPEFVLDLFSVTAGGKEYRVVTSDVDLSNCRGVGANRRTAEYAGGGSGLDTLIRTRANAVPDVFSETDDLIVLNRPEKKKKKEE
jgi:hypothetical protein